MPLVTELFQDLPIFRLLAVGIDPVESCVPMAPLTDNWNELLIIAAAILLFWFKETPMDTLD